MEGFIMKKKFKKPAFLVEFVNEFKSVVWPSKKQVGKEYIIVAVASIISIGFIELINLLMASVLSLF
jgi:preprotein translocase SecE subunit